MSLSQTNVFSTFMVRVTESLVGHMATDVCFISPQAFTVRTTRQSAYAWRVRSDRWTDRFGSSANTKLPEWNGSILQFKCPATEISWRRSGSPQSISKYCRAKRWEARGKLGRTVLNL